MKRSTGLFLGFVLAIVSSVAVPGQLPKDHWAKYDSGKVHYYDIGKRQKDAIVLVHGWTCNADLWRESLKAFPDYRVLAIDLPGHGRSDKPKATYSMEYFARAVDAVMRHAKVSQAVLIGHSMGTPVIRQFYRLYPDKTLGLVAVDGPLRPFGPRAQMDKFFEPLFAHYAEQAPIFIDGLLGSTRPDLRAGIRAVMLSTPDHVGVRAMRGMLDESIWLDDHIKVPVLAIVAARPNGPADIEATYRAIAPELDFQLWPGVGHFIFMEKPVEFNAAVTAFVTKNKFLKTSVRRQK